MSSRAMGKLFMAVCGWKVEGEFPAVPKMVIVAAPHTSNWDFVFGVAAMFVIGAQISWIGKHTLFQWYSDGIMRWLGGVPVDRRVSRGTVAQVVDIVEARAKMIITVSPEGTREKVARWKTGFYHIASGAKIPILLTGFDYSKKLVRIGPLFHPTGNLEPDLEAIRAFYSDIQGRHPKNFQSMERG